MGPHVDMGGGKPQTTLDPGNTLNQEDKGFRARQLRDMAFHSHPLAHAPRKGFGSVTARNSAPPNELEGPARFRPNLIFQNPHAQIEV